MKDRSVFVGLMKRSLKCMKDLAQLELCQEPVDTENLKELVEHIAFLQDSIDEAIVQEGSRAAVEAQLAASDIAVRYVNSWLHQMDDAKDKPRESKLLLAQLEEFGKCMHA